MAMQKKNYKNKKRRIKPVPVLILVTVLIGIIVSLALVFGKKTKQDAVNVSVSEIGGSSTKADVNALNLAKETTVSIDMDSCAIPIGTTLKVTASIDPVETEKSINWSSSDTNVFTVDSEGIITIKGKGTSALTATLGSASNAIVIEGILNSDSAKSQIDLPIFNLITSTATTSNGTTSNGTTSNGTTSNGTTSNGTTSNGTTSNGTSSNGTSNGTSSNGLLSNDISNNANPTNNSAVDNSGNTASAVTPSTVTPSTTTGSSNGTNNGTNVGLKSTELNESLNEIGYNKILSNVYVYQENNTYYGEIVIQSNVTIIYIKQRCEGYDLKIKQVIARLLPIENAQVWSNYISATSDRTFTVEGRMVRIVTAFNGGHSQIVIYN